MDVDYFVANAAAIPKPSVLKEGDLVLVENGEISKWVCLKCPGGCRQMIPLSLNPKQRPRWQLEQDWLGRPTVHPSIRLTNRCGCHFWITKGKTRWCEERPGTNSVNK